MRKKLSRGWRRRKFIGHVVAAVIIGGVGGGGGVPGTVHAQMTQPTTAPAGEPGDAPRPVDGANAQPGALMDQAANSASQIYVDDSFASIEKLHAAGRYASQGQSQLAITTYQNIISGYGQKLVYLNNDSYVSITDYVRGKLLQMPAVQDGMYDQLFGVQAKKEIDGGMEAHDLAQLIRACDQYFPSSAAFEGLSAAAEWHFERGEFAAASRIWQQLMVHPGVKGKQGELLFRAGVAESLNHNGTDARALRDRLAKEFPGITGMVDGAEVPLLGKLDEMLGLPRWDDLAVEKDEWPAFEGGASRSRLMAANASIGAQLWTVELGGGTPAVSGAAVRAARMNARAMAQRGIAQPGVPLDPRLISYPVLSAGTLLIHGGDRVMALSANAGTFLWAYPEQPSRASSDQGVNNGELPIQPSAHDSVSVMGDRVFAVLPAPVRSGAPTGDDEVEDYGAGGVEGTRVVCLDRADGHERWSTRARSIKLENKGVLTFEGAPVVAKEGVFVMARKVGGGGGAFVQLYLVRLDPDTGEPTWSCYLCSAASGMYYGPGVNFGNIPIPTLVDDVLYIATGQGATCAVDANVGRILWLEISASAKKPRAANDFYNPVREFAPSWKFNAPLVRGKMLVVYEANGGDAVITFFDRWTGKPIRSFTAKDFGVSDVDVMAGIFDSNLILTGSKVIALNLDKGGAAAAEVTAWRCEFPSPNETGKPEGRPFLTSSGLYVPFEKGMALIDPKAGKLREFWQWPRTQKDAAGKPGNLLVTSEQVVVVSEAEVAGYSRWETARDNRLGQIQAHPNEPEGYLSLAEIAFRTGHFDLAQENMKRSVELATASARWIREGRCLRGSIGRT